MELSESRCSLDCHPIGSPDLVHRYRDYHRGHAFDDHHGYNHMTQMYHVDNDNYDCIDFSRFADAVEDGTSCGGSGLQLCLAGVCEVSQHDT